MTQPVIVIHGGAGALTRSAMSEEKERRYLAALTEIVARGQNILAQNGSALDAVTEAVRLLEECPLFNAGRGSVFTHNATHELDASIMDGRSLDAGAVSCVSHIRNPVLAARTVLEQSQHVMFTAEGAEAFARQHDLEMVEPVFSRRKSAASNCIMRKPGKEKSCWIMMVKPTATPSIPIASTAPSALSRWTARVIWRRRPQPAA
ncbi:asparaginase [Brenneria salicis ATCC 15712 = DSM 30166]|uniref:Asparaginase n=1 Tax=Brenneria salicis ATCC 15712 = DSM 30166 TaxID=714314 RepID=A0A366HZX6_9GAMM|nr:asparaginase [Brenneria salicis ATCC 15712 = DSM 30166]